MAMEEEQQGKPWAEALGVVYRLRYSKLPSYMLCLVLTSCCLPREGSRRPRFPQLL